MRSAIKERAGVAVVRVGAIGDTLVLFPLLAELRRRGAARIVAIGREEVFAIAAEDGWCDEARSSESIGWWTVASDVDLDPRVARSLRGVDVLVDLDQASFSPRRLAAIGPRDRIAVPPLPPPAWDRPAARFYLDSLGFIEAPEFVASPRARRDPPPPSAPLVLVPGAGSPRKRAPVAWFAAIAREAERRGIGVIAVAGEADAAAIPELRSLRAPVSDVWTNVALAELVRRLACARAFVSNDGGIAHLAAYAGLRGVVRFLASDAKVWSPPSPRVRALLPDDDASPAAIVDALSAS
ncbi:MAG TPA: glycosyltransferase family 9 protein [Planctomycetota bacterium]|nr:glycosyltransferase family 9 protein [Planctomycetota bacterium]